MHITLLAKTKNHFIYKQNHFIYKHFIFINTLTSLNVCSLREQKKKKKINIQQPEFAGGHPPNY